VICVNENGLKDTDDNCNFGVSVLGVVKSVMNDRKEGDNAYMNSWVGRESRRYSIATV
jgi:hypothetical protein